jgi:hypothetical protein
VVLFLCLMPKKLLQQISRFAQKRIFKADRPRVAKAREDRLEPDPLGFKGIDRDRVEGDSTIAASEI